MTYFDDSAFRKQMDDLANINKEISQPVLKAFKDATPKRTGNARKQTTMSVTKNEIVINANYPYASELEKGASPKAPDGITKPAQKEINRIVNNFINKKGK